MRKLAVLADIHGNLPALEAVLDDIQRSETPDAIWVLGDLVAFFPWVHEVIECLNAQPILSCLQGNTDRYLATGQRHMIKVRSQREWEHYSRMLSLRDDSFRWMTERLTFQDYSFLRDLPQQLGWEEPGFGRILAVHGVPGNDETGITPETPPETVKSWLQNVDGRLLLTGHTHMPMDRSVGSLRIINPGSVGMVIGNQFMGSYAILDVSDGECRVEIHSVHYDGREVINKLKTSDYPGANGLLQRMEMVRG
ncbi:MAG: metallophosphoesterase family protein [Anaerolineaceae bacterium]|nr:metallophosphoesterase family protein [Anaerolineaceae bacterium]